MIVEWETVSVSDTDSLSAAGQRLSRLTVGVASASVSESCGCAQDSTKVTIGRVSRSHDPSSPIPSAAEVEQELDYGYG